MSKPISISLAAPKLPVASKQPLSKKRPAANLDSDSDDDDGNHREKVHVITAFDAARGGAVGEEPEEEEKGPLVISTLKNRDWRAEAERRRGRGSVWLPPEAFASHAEGEGEEAMEVDTGAGVHYGLQVFQRPTEDNQTPPPPPPEQAGGEAVEEKTEEEQALAALLSNSSKPPSTTLILPPSSSAGNADWRDEQQAYKSDVASRPDVPTLDDYAAVPVEEFGAALLRGMGWREGMELGGRGGSAKQAKLRTVEKRPAFLGIGAKAKEEVPELGTWGKADKSGRKRGGKRVDTTYVPVVLVDKKTGRVVDESAVVENGKGAGSGGGSSGVDRDRWDGRDQERARDDPDHRRRDRSRDHRDSHRHHNYHHRERDRDRDRHGDKHRDRERGEKSHRSRDERDNRRRSRDRYERRDRR
ncbi:DExH-box splicing factor binding site-domain-containing protein [Tuber indicum]|nr:DExH-box splicing factor binding site-domain-containing protein [Tuber indicum]